MASVAVKWMEERSRLFVCRDSSGNMVMSGSGSGGGAGGQEWRATKPTDLLLMGLATCAAFDVVAILERQRQPLGGLRIEVDGRQQAEPPYAFTDIHMHFLLSGGQLDPVKVERALNLSINKYCSVAATIRAVATITYGFEIEA